eukprot:9504184-Lingulodinium_polyedra.AAC.1
MAPSAAAAGGGLLDDDAMEQDALEDLDTHLRELGEAGKLTSAQMGVWKKVQKRVRSKRPSSKS